MLLEIIKLFQERKTISKSDLAFHFKIQESATDAILEKLVKKNIIKPINSECSLCNSGCKTCPFSSEKDTFVIV